MTCTGTGIGAGVQQCLDVWNVGEHGPAHVHTAEKGEKRREQEEEEEEDR